MRQSKILQNRLSIQAVIYVNSKIFETHASSAKKKNSKGRSSLAVTHNALEVTQCQSLVTPSVLKVM